MTIEQHLSTLWKDYHTKTITSKFKIIYRCKEVTEDFVKWLLNPPDLSHVPAIQHGRQYESTAAKAYQALKSGVENFKMRECGLVLHTEYSFLGASPDWLVSKNGMFGLVEIKCPYSMYGRTIQEARQKSNFCCEINNATPSLKLYHEYYYQIQGQLAITGVEWCDFVVWLGNGPGQIHVQCITYDVIFWETLIFPILHEFFLIMYIHFWRPSNKEKNIMYAYHIYVYV